jgi:uncharacterized protein (DUF2141 family)
MFSFSKSFCPATAIHAILICILAMAGCQGEARSKMPSQIASGGQASPLPDVSPPVASPPDASPPVASPKADAQPEPQRLIVEVEGFSDRQGRCRIALYKEAEGFNQPQKAWAKETLDIPAGDVLVWAIESNDPALNDPQTRWAISAHQDRNDNDKIDKNALGIPTEPYGFSNNPKRGFGPPKFDEVSFKIASQQDQQTTRIKIKLQ